MAPQAPRGITRYALSLPERVIRSVSALAGGLIRELGAISVPPHVRRTRLYRSMVETTLRFLIEQVGEVEGTFPGEQQLSSDFLLRRTAGSGIDMIGMLAFRASPIWVLAALADVSGAGRQLVLEISDALKDEGLLSRDTRFETVDQMLDGLEQSAGQMLTTISAPPLDVAGLRRDWQAIRDSAAKIPPQHLPSAEVLRRNWDRLKRTAAEQHRPVFEISAAVALSAVTALPSSLQWLSKAAEQTALRASQLFAGTLLDHYTNTLNEIEETGYLAWWRQEFRPYLRAAAGQFSRDHVSLTERLLRRRATGGTT